MAKPPADPLGESLQRMLAEVTPIKPEAVLAEIEDILRVRPTRQELGSADAMAWLGRVKAALHHWDAVQATGMILIEPKLHSIMVRDFETGYREVLALLNQA